MGVDSNVFVVADKSLAAEAGQAVLDALSKWQRDQLDAHATSLGYDNRMQFMFSNENEKPNGQPRWTNGAHLHATSFDCFQFVFTLDGDNRTLWYFTDCSCDTNYIIKDHTLMFSIGHWGANDKIMNIVIDALKPFGPVYYDHNDCDEEDYILQN